MGRLPPHYKKPFPQKSSGFLQFPFLKRPKTKGFPPRTGTNRPRNGKPFFIVMENPHLPQQTRMARAANSAVPSPPALSMFRRKRSSAAYISPSPARISGVQV